MNYQKISVIGLLGLFLTTSMPVAALASVNVETNKNNYASVVSNWTKYGNVEVLNDGRVKVTENRNQDGHLYTDVSIPSKFEDDYVVFVSFTRAEKPYSNYSDGGENISGLPVLSAYFLDNKGKILEYVTDVSTMRQKSSDGTYWHVSYGIVEVENNSQSMRLFLDQASSALTTADGRAAWFYKPGLFFTESKSDATDIVEAYKNELNEMSDEFDNNNDNVNYPTGTLLGCWGEAKVYSVTSDDTLKLFPDEDTFYAWGHSFSEVKKISCDDLDDYKISGRWTYERANYLVKFEGQRGVYTLDNGKYLRLIPNEVTAKKMYGRNWHRLVREFPARDVRDYSYSAPHRSLR